jgi:hypothetical protein
MSLNDSLDAVQRAKLAVWDYPVSNKYTKLWETDKGFKAKNRYILSTIFIEDVDYTFQQ